MVDKIYLKASSEAFKSPTFGQLELGELAINCNESSPSIYIRTTGSTDRIVRIGPAIVQATAPVFTGGGGIDAGAFWLNPNTDKLSIYIDSTRQWVTVRGRSAIVSVNSPSAPQEGDLWFDTVALQLKVWSNSSASWIESSKPERTTIYYGESDPVTAADELTFIGFSSLVNGVYRGQKDFRYLSGGSPVVGYGINIPDAGSRIYRKEGTNYSCWRRAGYWYLGDASSTAGTWYRSINDSFNNPVDVSGWVSITNNTETTPVRAGVNVTGISVVRPPLLSLVLGEVWYDSDDQLLKVWNGSSWQSSGVRRAEIEESKPELVVDSTLTTSFNYPISATRSIISMGGNGEFVNTSFIEKINQSSYRIIKTGTYSTTVSAILVGLTGGTSGSATSFVVQLRNITKDRTYTMFYRATTENNAFRGSTTRTLYLEAGDVLQLGVVGLSLSSISRVVTVSSVEFELTKLWVVA